ncbi:MAG TPA: alpha/beta fold hydrolase [Planctomycetota bacterium]|nr:alpha/beta fold hydrolase [Planctomycetota bacterium]
MTRSVLTWRIQGEDLVGTLHAPDPEWSGDGQAGQDLALLLLNSGPAPRAGNSDLSVHVAERLASRGIPVLRFDFAGLGDSSGETPNDKEQYWRDVLAGRNDQTTMALVRRVKRELGLSRVVVGGLCAAALPTLRAADRDSNDVSGVILLEPAFHLTIPRVVTTADSRPAVVSPKRNLLERALSVREWLLFLTGENPLARACRPLRTQMLEALKASFGHTLPTDANVALVCNWQNSLARGVPSLVVVAEGQRADCDLPRILGSLPKERAALVSQVRIPRTNHILTAGTARETVVDSIDRWIAANFGAPTATRVTAHG